VVSERDTLTQIVLSGTKVYRRQRDSNVGQIVDKDDAVDDGSGTEFDADHLKAVRGEARR